MLPGMPPGFTGAPAPSAPAGPEKSSPPNASPAQPAQPLTDAPKVHTPAEIAKAEARAEQAERALTDSALYQPASSANSVMAIWGDTGTGKTDLICTGVEYCWETFHRIAHIVTADPGGYGAKLLRLIRFGVCEAWNLLNHVDSFETIELATLGCWPERILNKETGYADPYVQLLPPERRNYIIYCQNGHPFPPLIDRRQLTMFQGLCPTCQVMTNLQNLSHVDEKVIRTKGFKHLGMVAFDSGTTLQDHVMNDMADRAGRDELGGEKGAINNIQSGSMMFGANNRAHYGFAQIRAYQWLINSRKIPGLVLPPIWTFRADRGSDEKNAPVYGPAIAGTAKTAALGGWVGHMIHTEKVIDSSNRDNFRAWLAGHRNPQEGNVLYLAKVRAEPGTFDAPYLQDGPNEAPYTRFNLGYFFRKIDEAFAKSMALSAPRFADAPALKPFEDDDEEEVTQSQLSTTQLSGMTRAPAPAIGGIPASAMGVPGAMPGAPGTMPGATALPGMPSLPGAPPMAVQPTLPGVVESPAERPIVGPSPGLIREQLEASLKKSAEELAALSSKTAISGTIPLPPPPGAPPDMGPRMMAPQAAPVRPSIPGVGESK